MQSSAHELIRLISEAADRIPYIQLEYLVRIDFFY